MHAFYPHLSASSSLIPALQQNLPKYDEHRRERVVAVLERQNRSWGASAATFANIERLRAGANAIVTGQQVSLFGGPLFSLLKAMTAVNLADKLSSAGTDAVPIFWLATEDHDLDEVSGATLLGPDGELHEIRSVDKGRDAAPVGGIRFSRQIEELTANAESWLGNGEAVAVLKQSYRAGETFGSAFAKFYAKVLGAYGVILLDASDPELHAVASPVYRSAVLGAEELNQSLLARDKQLETSGYHAQVKVTPSSALLFSIRDGARLALQRQNGSFNLAGANMGPKELMERIGHAPASFSPNALLRPVVQDYLLPTIAYVGGPAEVAYFAQSAVVYQELLGRVTPILPRISATLVEPRVQRLLEKYGLQPADVLEKDIAQEIGLRTLSKEVSDKFAETRASLETHTATLVEKLAELDSTIAEAGKKATKKMVYQLERLHGRAARAELRRAEVLQRHARHIVNSLYPHKTLQERAISGVSFLARYGDDLLKRLSALPPEKPEHHIVYL